MIGNKLICVICRGFNKFFDAPKADGRTLVTFRTAIVIKKRLLGGRVVKRGF